MIAVDVYYCTEFLRTSEGRNRGAGLETLGKTAMAFAHGYQGCRTGCSERWLELEPKGSRANDVMAERLRARRGSAREIRSFPANHRLW